MRSRSKTCGPIFLDRQWATAKTGALARVIQLRDKPSVPRCGESFGPEIAGWSPAAEAGTLHCTRSAPGNAKGQLCPRTKQNSGAARSLRESGRFDSHGFEGLPNAIGESSLLPHPIARRLLDPDAARQPGGFSRAGPSGVS